MPRKLIGDKKVNIPDGILCSKTHSWALEEGSDITVGLTDIAAEQLGDIVFVELPEEGASFLKDEPFAALESVKAASEIYMPISGEVTEVNEALIKTPELINEDAFSAWFIKVKPSNYEDDIEGLMDYDDYKDEVQ